MDEFTLFNARIVLDDAVIDGAVRIADGDIVSIDPNAGPLPGSIDFEGDYLLPGLVDLHTDHLEKHVLPRPHVRWNIERAILAHDAQIISGGVTTVFDSLSVGASEKSPERKEILQPMIDGLEKAGEADLLRAEHLVHLRCEITDADVPELTRANVGRDIVRLISVMEHVPGKRQSRDVESYISRRMAASGKTREQVELEITELLERLEAEAIDVRAEVVAMAAAADLPLMSHDDATEDHIRLAQDEGARLAEFPVSLEAARKARAAGMGIVAGAPNFLRGGSQAGNVAVSNLLAEGLVDILASDYVPRSMLDCAFAIAQDKSLAIDLPAAIRMVTSAPARASGLEDRGEILPGMRADLVRVRLHQGIPIVRAVWRSGQRVN